tara:strand:- start:167635 stop:168495 length:861 start_codon:yes stop_codon:yes gene_type:complete
MKISEILNKSVSQISNNIGISDSASYIEAEHLILKVLKTNRSSLYIDPERSLTIKEEKYFSILLKKRLKGKPLAQILGYQDFYDDKFLINDDVLIPRSETELILPEIIKYGDSISSNNSNFKIVDAGSGSGCIGLSLAKKRLKWNVICIENCFKAIKILNLNIKNLKLENVSVLQSDWLSSLRDESIDIIISNPPYIETDSQEIDDNVKNFEPSHALYAGKNGLKSILKIIQQSRRVLKKNGYLFLENGFNQSKQVTQILCKYNFKDINVLLDYNNIQRFTVSQRY